VSDQKSTSAVAERPRRSGRTIVVYLHGRGSDESSANHVRAAFGDADLVAPRGRLVEGGGFAWFRNVSPGVALAASLRAEAQVLAEVLDERCPSSDVWLCGFSNGAAMASTLLLARPDRYQGVLLLSGPIVDERPWPARRLQGVPVLMIYGREDRMIPRELMLRSAHYLTGESGALASVREVDGGHEISSIAVQIITDWFSAQVTARAAT